MEADILVVIGAGEKVKRVVFHAEVMVGMNVVHAEGMVENDEIGAWVQVYMLILRTELSGLWKHITVLKILWMIHITTIPLNLVLMD
jgi:hypothetical protein